MIDSFYLAPGAEAVLDDPDRYANHPKSGLRIAPLRRQFATAREILSRFRSGRGVLLADDVGLGKTTIGAIVAWIVACQRMRVRIYAPNDIMRRRWAEELERHVPMLAHIGATTDRIRQYNIPKLNPGRVQIATHYALVQSHWLGEQRTGCDLMIIDEAHHAKGEGSRFKRALDDLGDRATRKLILTATPFSIRIVELENLLRFVGATDLEAVRDYADNLKQLHAVKQHQDIAAEARSITSAARKAIGAIQPYIIRHCIGDLTPEEGVDFGHESDNRWEIDAQAATPDDLELLLRMDRILQLAPERKGERRNDPRFHIGWQHLGQELDRAAKRTHKSDERLLRRHIQKARQSLKQRRANPHPKIAAVISAIASVMIDEEKVLIFCHHRATAAELLEDLEVALTIDFLSGIKGPPEPIWRSAWSSVLPDVDPLVAPIIDWLCTPGIRRQVAAWLKHPARDAESLAHQLRQIRPRHTKAPVPTIAESAIALAQTILDKQSTSTRSLMKNILRGTHSFGSGVSRFPGRLDDGIRVMGSWQPDGPEPQLKTLYAKTADIVLAIFNSPFGPDVLVATDRLSEGVDLHRSCRHLIHYELDPSPVRMIQRNGRVRRVGSWAALTGRPILQAYPVFGGTRDEKAVEVMRQRIQAFGMLLGGVPPLDETVAANDGFVEQVLERAGRDLESINRKLSV